MIVSIPEQGAIGFGAVFGWIVYLAYWQNVDKMDIKWLATLLGVIGGVSITTLFSSPPLFGAYGIGLAGGFFTHMIFWCPFALKVGDLLKLSSPVPTTPKIPETAPAAKTSESDAARN